MTRNCQTVAFHGHITGMHQLISHVYLQFPQGIDIINDYLLVDAQAVEGPGKGEFAVEAIANPDAFNGYAN